MCIKAPIIIPVLTIPFTNLSLRTGYLSTSIRRAPLYSSVVGYCVWHHIQRAITFTISILIPFRISPLMFCIVFCENSGIENLENQVDPGTEENVSSTLLSYDKIKKLSEIKV